MGQRVNIQYSVDLRDLCTEVHELIDKANIELLNLIERSKNNLQECDEISLKMVRDLSQFREGLADIDYRLGDVALICNGYLNYETQKQQKQQQPPPVPTDTPDGAAMDNINDLKKTLQDFKKSLPNE